MKLFSPKRETLEQHYSDLKDKPFFKDIIDCMLRGPVVCMVWQGLDVVKTCRKKLGTTNPLNSNPGTVRGDYDIETRLNTLHGSYCPENAEKEIKLWFKDEEITQKTRINGYTKNPYK